LPSIDKSGQPGTQPKADSRDPRSPRWSQGPPRIQDLWEPRPKGTQPKADSRDPRSPRWSQGPPRIQDLWKPRPKGTQPKADARDPRAPLVMDESITDPRSLAPKTTPARITPTPARLAAGWCISDCFPILGLPQPKAGRRQTQRPSPNG